MRLKRQGTQMLIRISDFAVVVACRGINDLHFREVEAGEP